MGDRLDEARFKPGDAAQYVLHPGSLGMFDVRVLALANDREAFVQFEFGKVELAPLDKLLKTSEIIANTDRKRRHPWPADAYVQGGGDGIVATRSGTYRTAFVEVFPKGQGFIRGEGPTIEAAEDAAWVKWQRHSACPGHEYEARGYTNGAGFCRHCGAFGSKVFTGADLGQHCKVCGAGTTWCRRSPQAWFNPVRGLGYVEDPAPEEERDWYCEAHDPFKAERELHDRWEVDLSDEVPTVEAREAFKAAHEAQEAGRG